MIQRLPKKIIDNARLVIAVLLVVSAVAAIGVPMVERSTSLNQFQTDAAEADALEYVENNFSTAGTNTTTAQIIVRDETVLDGKTLVSMLEYERTLRANETVNETLVSDDPIRSVANLLATASIRQERVSDLRTLDPSLESQIDELRSLNETQLDALVSDVLGGNTTRSTRALRFMPESYEPGATRTNATLMIVTQETPGGSFAPGDAPESIEASQTAMAALEPDGESMSILVYGNGIVSTEILHSMTDSILLVGPLALAFVLLVLAVVYRDPLDILLGVLGIGLVLLWTFGAMGWLDIAFSQPFIVVLVLLIGLSIDYGIHVVMRYREARSSADVSPSRAMAAGLGGVGVALTYTTVTTAIGFLSNLTSPLSIFRQLGIVSAIGIVAALVVFGVFVPALKVELDAFLEARGIDRVKPAVGTGHGPVNRILDAGATLATKAPYVVIVIALLVSSVGVYGATQVNASFDQSDFLAEDPADWVKDLPEPFAPRTYTAERAIDILNDRFVRRDTTATILVRGDITDPATLDRLERARANASEMSVVATYASGSAAISGPLTTMHRVAAHNGSFNATLAAADVDGDGVPDQSVTAVFDALYRVSPEKAASVIARSNGEYNALRVEITVDGTASGETVHEQMGWVAEDIEGDGVTAIATGDVIVNQVTANQLATTAILSLVVALLSVLVVIAVAYRITEGSASLGVVTIVPVGFTLTWILGSMAALDIPFNIVTGMITGLTIGMGVDYSLHISERFNQELADAETVEAALHETVIGTGGALVSSAATTAGGFAVLLVAILPFLQSFGLITALTIVYAFLAAVFVLPSLLVVWARFARDEERQPTEATEKQPMETTETAISTDNGVSRTIERPYVLPEQSVPVTVSLRGITGRVSLRETVPAEISDVDVSPEPIAMYRDDGTLTVIWDVAAETAEATVSYEAALPGYDDGEEFVFDGTVTTAGDERPVDGDNSVTVVGDLFQRVIARGEITAADIEIAANSQDISDEEFDRLRQAWLEQ